MTFGNPSSLGWDDRPILDGKRAIVVGGGGAGIGGAIAESISRAGADVAVADVAESRAKNTVERILSTGRKGVSITADVLNAEDISRMVIEADTALGGIDVLVTVVGGQTAFSLPFVPLHQYTQDQVRLSFGLNIGYVVEVVRNVLPIMVAQQRGGSIVSVGSISGGPNGAAHQAVYGASKAALSSLARSIAAEYGHVGIRMNVVAPGTVQTPTTAGRDRNELDLVLTRVPLGRRAQPEDVAAAVVFFASDISSYITGQTLAVDGGATACHPLPHASLSLRTQGDPPVSVSPGKEVEG